LHNTRRSGADSIAISQPPFNLRGAGLTALAAFVLVWVFKQSYYNISHVVTWSELLLASILGGIFGVIVYAYTRRHLLLYLRRRAIDVASELVANAQSFGSVTTSILSLVQEVELVSRGYQM